ncbi:MAG: LamG domain-containing protein [Planctomycetota bacterium]|jgi:hypothetical protein
MIDRRFMVLAIIVSAVASGSRAWAADLTVPEGTTRTITGIEMWENVRVHGTLIVEDRGFLIATDESTLDGPAAEIIVNDGRVRIEDRFNVGQGSDGYITLNGGLFTVSGTFKFPDRDGGVHRIYLNDGIMWANDIEFQGARDAIMYVGGGVLHLDTIEGGDRDPQQWKDDEYLLAGEGYDEVVIEYVAAGEYTEVSAISADPNLAGSPHPADGATNVAPAVALSWSPGVYAAWHDVYLGTDFNDVNSASDPNTLPGRGRQDANDYTPPELFELQTTWYWRVDEVNGIDLWKGRVWKFTVADFIPVDDFESYDLAANRIHYTWDDGAINGTGSYIDLGTKPFDPVHGPDQSMEYLYDNAGDWGNGYYSEAELPFDGPQDWTVLGMKALTLYFYGDPGNDTNDTEQLYVGLGGSYAEVRYGSNGEDMNDLKLAEWTEWNIAISDFDNPDPVDPCAVTSLFVGFGDRNNNTTAGGDGIAYFDDIRLYPPRCVPKYGPALDFSGNCIVDWPDVEIMVNEWLRTDAQLTTSAPSPGPVGWWKLDDGGGGIAWDDSGNFHDGTIEDSYSWTDGRIGPAALEFMGDGGRILVPDHAQLRPTTKVSASAWAYFSVSQGHSARIVVKGADNNETYALETNGDDAGFYVRDTDSNRFNVNSDDIWRDEWTHLAGTFDGDTNTVILYLNGQEADSRDDADFVSQQGKTLSQDTNDLAIGNRSDATNREFIGSVDDIRVYDYALSAAEVAYLATEGTGYVPLTSQTNLYDQEPAGQKAINLRDLAVLLDYWLLEKLWP